MPAWLKATLILAAVVVLGVVGWLWLQASTDSYDKRYESCMNRKQTALYPQGHYWPDDRYNEAMQQCEREAGVPAPDQGNKNSWREGW